MPENYILTTDFSANIIKILKQIPYGSVTTYGTVALLAGSPGGARQVARILHSSSKALKLPWHRVVNYRGEISLRPSMSHLQQRILLEKEGVEFDETGAIDLDTFLWLP